MRRVSSLSRITGTAAKKSGGYVDGHVENVGDRLALESDLEGFAVVAPALADIALDVDVGQEMHLDLDQAVALAGFAAPALTLNENRPGL